MNDLVRYDEHLPQSAASIRAQVNLIQEVMQAVMKEGTHYGTIPGTPKPSLWKPGAEVLGSTFHIATSYRVEDLSGADFVRYRVTAVGTHQATGVVMGEGMGECSSMEEKYKWRKSTGEREFDATAEDRRRIKYGRDYSTKQVRADPADQANTILKMACKRAQVAMMLNVTAASDIFSQDFEDLPEELRPSAEEAPATQVKKPQSKKSAAPAAQPAPSAPPSYNGSGAAPDPNAPKLSEGQLRILKARMESAEVTEQQIADKFKMPLAEIPGSMFNDVSAFIRGAAPK